MPPTISLAAVPYDSGRRDWRHGAGPGALVSAGAAERLAATGASVDVSTIECDGRMEIATGVEVMRRVGAHVAAAVTAGALPVVLAGNCGATLGVVAGLRAATPGRRVAVLWFDAHGDLQTPATSTSGFFDGMGFAMLTGRCWPALAATVPGHAPLPDDLAVLVGGHDLDDAEVALLADAGITHLTVPDVRAGVDAEEALAAALAERADAVHVHVDLDVHDTALAPANSYAVPGGFTAEEVRRVVAAIARRLPVASATVASWDPTLDVQDRLRDAALDLLEHLGTLAG